MKNRQGFSASSASPARFSAISAVKTLLLALALFWLAGAGFSQTTRTLTILHTNDVHGHLLAARDGRGGWANIAAYAKKLKAERNDVLLLDAGDMTQGTAESTVFHGRPIFEVMNAASYDAATWGNHEFDDGHSVDEFLKIAKFPILSANILRGGLPLADAPTTVVTVNGLRVGLIGLTTQSFIERDEIKVIPADEALAQRLPALEKESDLVVVLSHNGVDADKALAEKFPAISVIVGGHSHTPVETPLKVGETLIVQAGYHGKWLGRLDLTIEPGAAKPVVAYEGRLIPVPVAGLKPDAETEAVINKWESQLPGMEEVIGQLAQPMNLQALERAIEAVWLEAYKTDFAFQNPGGTRIHQLPAGPIYERDIWDMMPFNNTIVILTLERSQLTQYFEKAPAKDDARTSFTLATNSYTAEKAIKQMNLPPNRVRRLPDSWRQPVIDYVKRHGTLMPGEPTSRKEKAIKK